MNRSFLTAAAIVVSVVVQTPGVAAGEQPDGSDGPAVFVMTNNADHNEVIAFPRADTGTLRLGYKMAKYIMRIELVETLKTLAGGRGGYWEDRGYEWYGGI